jgi:hypothetical protein
MPRMRNTHLTAPKHLPAKDAEIAIAVMDHLARLWKRDDRIISRSLTEAAFVLEHSITVRTIRRRRRPRSRVM